MKIPIQTFVAAVALAAAVAAAQDANQAPKNPPVQDITPTSAVPTSSISSSGTALFPMPVIPDEDRAGASAQSSAASSQGPELFPMPSIPDEDRAEAPVPSASDGGPETRAFPAVAPSSGLFPMPEVPEEDHPSTPAPLTEAELEMQALIQSAIGKNPAVTSPNVSVAFSAEGIELSGTVASVQSKLAASRLAKSYAAGRKVVDRITVAANPPETHPEPSPVRVDSPATHQQHP